MRYTYALTFWRWLPHTPWSLGAFMSEEAFKALAIRRGWLVRL
jgi:hypothetical protein